MALPRTPLVVLLVVAALAPLGSAKVGTEGPFAGFVVQNQTNVHLYDNTPPDGICPQYFAPVPYTVSLTYSPPADVLTLELLGRSGPVLGRHGVASISFEGGGCEMLAIAVTGTSVAYVATYTVHVTQTGGGAES